MKRMSSAGGPSVVTKRATTKLLAATAIALFANTVGGFAGEANAHTASDTGTYDDQMDLALEACWGSISLPVAWQVGDPESVVCAHSRT